uniref:Uncharacterized protein n=1 Tax=Lepeophtheirus salmonis TaxID=72036 RepID=A0A0K2UVK6_LEPSM
MIRFVPYILYKIRKLYLLIPNRFDVMREERVVSSIKAIGLIYRVSLLPELNVKRKIAFLFFDVEVALPWFCSMRYSFIDYFWGIDTLRGFIWCRFFSYDGSLVTFFLRIKIFPWTLNGITFFLDVTVFIKEVIHFIHILFNRNVFGLNSLKYILPLDHIFFFLLLFTWIKFFNFTNLIALLNDKWIIKINKPWTHLIVYIFGSKG